MNAAVGPNVLRSDPDRVAGSVAGFLGKLATLPSRACQEGPLATAAIWFFRNAVRLLPVTTSSYLGFSNRSQFVLNDQVALLAEDPPLVATTLQ